MAAWKAKHLVSENEPQECCVHIRRVDFWIQCVYTVDNKRTNELCQSYECFTLFSLLGITHWVKGSGNMCATLVNTKKCMFLTVSYKSRRWYSSYLTIWDEWRAPMVIQWTGGLSYACLVNMYS